MAVIELETDGTMAVLRRILLDSAVAVIAIGVTATAWNVSWEPLEMRSEGFVAHMVLFTDECSCTRKTAIVCFTIMTDY